MDVVGGLIAVCGCLCAYVISFIEKIRVRKTNKSFRVSFSCVRVVFVYRKLISCEVFSFVNTDE